jgi:hypothetical protein
LNHGVEVHIPGFFSQAAVCDVSINATGVREFAVAVVENIKACGPSLDPSERSACRSKQRPECQVGHSRFPGHAPADPTPCPPVPVSPLSSVGQWRVISARESQPENEATGSIAAGWHHRLAFFDVVLALASEGTGTTPWVAWRLYEATGRFKHFEWEAAADSLSLPAPDEQRAEPGCSAELAAPQPVRSVLETAADADNDIVLREAWRMCGSRLRQHVTVTDWDDVTRTLSVAEFDMEAEPTLAHCFHLNNRGVASAMMAILIAIAVAATTCIAWKCGACRSGKEQPLNRVVVRPWAQRSENAAAPEPQDGASPWGATRALERSALLACLALLPCGAAHAARARHRSERRRDQGSVGGTARRGSLEVPARHERQRWTRMRIDVRVLAPSFFDSAQLGRR